MTNLPIGINYLNEVPISETVFLHTVSKTLGLSLKKLVSEVSKLNNKNPIELFVQVREHSIEADQWAIENGGRKPQSFSEEYYNGQKVLNIFEQPSGLLRLSDHHKILLANKKSVEVAKIWSDDINYIRPTTPISVQRKNLLISKAHADKIINILTTQQSPITYKELLNELDTLRRDNEQLKKKIENLEDQKSSNTLKNRERLYAIIAGLTQEFVPPTLPYIKNDGTPNFIAVARKIVTAVKNNNKTISEVDSVRGIISESMQNNNFYTPPDK